MHFLTSCQVLMLLRMTWFVVVEHQEELNQPGKLCRLEHLPDEAKLAEVDHKPGLLLCSLLQSKMLHDGDESFLCEHIVLHLDIEGAPALCIPVARYVAMKFKRFLAK